MSATLQQCHTLAMFPNARNNRAQEKCCNALDIMLTPYTIITANTLGHAQIYSCYRPVHRRPSLLKSLGDKLI